MPTKPDKFCTECNARMPYWRHKRCLPCGDARVKAKKLIQAPVHAILHGALCRHEIIRQPCEVCATTVNVVAHHDDYSKPLDVRWLCRSHHQKHHLRFGPGKSE